jgi:cholesterol transport system auxiliary component
MNKIERPRRLWYVLLAAALAAGCAIGANSRFEIAVYDFGTAAIPAGRQVLTKTLVVHEVSAPAWMDTPSIFYRLAYRDAARTHAYANSRWVMPPGALLGARLRQRLAAVSSAGIVLPQTAIRTEYALRVELEEFTQVFDTADRSRALARLRATFSGPRGLVGQRTFSAEKQTATPDSEGGVRALAGASDEAIDQLIEWLSSQI